MTEQNDILFNKNNIRNFKKIYFHLMEQTFSIIKFFISELHKSNYKLLLTRIESKQTKINICNPNGQCDK